MKVVIGACAALSVGLAPSLAAACGCFAPPSPAEPVVQAGERIVFSHEDGKVVAHIQIQYQGEASEFAWLVPVPKVPEVRVGTEELFTEIQARTNPQFLLNRIGNCGGGGGGFGCSEAEAFSAGNFAEPMEPMPPVAVEVASAGPYDYAVVRADEKQPMVDWLNDNRFFVPAGTAEAMDPYIRPGAYFLALRLRAGESVGALQPIILEYEADLPMIPIVLTSVAAIPDMGILVWVLGEARAIPHNYQHVEINDEYIDWTNDAANYAQVVARAIDEADGGHAFITEYASSTSPMVDVLDPAGRFGSKGRISAMRSLADLERYLRGAQWPRGPVQAIYARHYPLPEAAVFDGVTAEQYYADLANLVSVYDPERAFDPAAIADDVWERIVEPTLEAGQMFRDHPMMTRLFTALDPEEMTKDPVFAFNPDLPEVARERSATIENTCGDNPSAIMHLSDGRSFELAREADWIQREKVDVPRTRIIQVMRQEGAPEVVVDNRALLAAIDDGADGGGCQSTVGDRSRVMTYGMMFVLLAVGRRLSRRREG